MKAEATVGVVVGVAATFITATVLAKMQKLIAEAQLEAQSRVIEEEIDTAKFNAYNEGWNKALNSERTIFNRFVELFGQEKADELTGTTTSERKPPRTR